MKELVKVLREVARVAWVLYGCKLAGHAPSQPDAMGIRWCWRCFSVLPPALGRDDR